LAQIFEFREGCSDFRESSQKILKIIENRFFIITSIHANNLPSKISGELVDGSFVDYIEIIKK
jgi:hypothetical protein